MQRIVLLRFSGFAQRLSQPAPGSCSGAEAGLQRSPRGQHVLNESGRRKFSTGCEDSDIVWLIKLLPMYDWNWKLLFLRDQNTGVPWPPSPSVAPET